MENKKKSFMIGVLIISFIVLALSGYAVYNFTTKNQNSSDITKFITQYESLNKKEDHNGKTAIELDLNEDATIFYKTDQEIMDLMQNKEAIIYFGFSSCPWCRSIITTLLEATVDEEITLYYVDIEDIRNTYIYENGELTESSTGTTGYYEILDFLDEYLSDYIIKDEDNNEHNTNTKRLYAPSVVTVKGGEVVEFFSPSSDMIDDPYEELSDKEELNLYNKFLNLIKNLRNEPCSSTSGC